MYIDQMLEKWKSEMPVFKEKTEKFLSGELPKGDYKGFSGRFGSYAQKDGEHFMLRLRTPGGRVTFDKMDYVTDMIQKYGVKRTHLTTCQTMQFHDLTKDQLFACMDEALERGIIIMGGGGDFPRNTMCSPLSGVEIGENFDVMKYALAAGNYLLGFIDAPKMPRKLKVCFTNTDENLTHATFRDLGFVARKDGMFDIYSGGGLGNNPKLGVKVAEKVDPMDILYYIKAMWAFFCAYGNYENRGRARTRYIQEVLETPENYVRKFEEKLEEVRAENEDLRELLEKLLAELPKVNEIEKKGDGSVISDKRVIAQKQDGLYAVAYHPLGGVPSMETMKALEKVIRPMKDVEIRIAPDETEYIINLTAKEAALVLEATREDHAATLFESSVSCIGATTCQVGVRDSQGLLQACVKAVREAGIKDGALPKIRISGCPSSCAAHQAGIIAFRGGVKKTEDGMKSAYALLVGGNEKIGAESLATEVGTILEEEIPMFLVDLGKTVEASKQDFMTWYAGDCEKIIDIAKKYI